MGAIFSKNSYNMAQCHTKPEKLHEWTFFSHKVFLLLQSSLGALKKCNFHWLCVSEIVTTNYGIWQILPVCCI